MEQSKIAVIRVRGQIGIRPEIEKTLKNLFCFSAETDTKFEDYCLFTTRRQQDCWIFYELQTVQSKCLFEIPQFYCSSVYKNKEKTSSADRQR